MHCSQLNIMTTVLIANHTTFLRNDLERMALLAQQYWTMSRNRVGHWNEQLYHTMLRCQAGEIKSDQRIAESMRLVEEVLLSQLYTRVWGGLLALYDHQNQLGDEDRLSGLGLSIVSCHEDASNRALEILTQLSESGHPRTDVVNRLRRRIERWTDMLLAQISRTADLSEFAFDAIRVKDILSVNARSKDVPTTGMLVGGVQAAQIEATRLGIAEQSNRKLASMTLSCLPQDAWLEADLRLELSVMRSDQFAWEIARLVERAIWTEYSPMVGQAVSGN